MLRWIPRGYRLIAAADYGVFLPSIARLPPRLAAPLIVLRGCGHYLFDLEWRTIALRMPFVRARTQAAMATLAPAANAWRARWLTLRRFLTVAREEYDGWRIARGRLGGIRCRVEGIEALLDARRAGRGVVLLTAHFDSLYVGLVALAQRGLTINLMSTRTVEDPRVPPAVRRHFRNKIAGMNRLFAPGRVMHFEDSLKFFVRALQNGEVVVIACDSPAQEGQAGTPVRFFGGPWAMVPGPEFLARKADALASMYVCEREGVDSYAVSISPPRAPDENGIQLAFDFLAAHVRAAPYRWWAADTFPTWRRVEATLPAATGATDDA